MIFCLTSVSYTFNRNGLAPIDPPGSIFPPVRYFNRMLHTPADARPTGQSGTEGEVMGNPAGVRKKKKEKRRIKHESRLLAKVLAEKPAEKGKK